MGKRILSIFVLIYWSNIVKLGFISPEEIIVYPKSCVNITLSDEICDQILEVKLKVYKSQVNQYIWFFDYPKDKFNYYYSRYLNNIRATWVSLCDLDHILTNRELELKVIKKNKIKYYVSSKINIAHCGYVSGCQDIVFPNNNEILNHVTQISDFMQDIKIKLNFPSIEPIFFLRFSLCPRFHVCHHIDILSSEDTSNYKFHGVLVHFDIPSKLFIFQVTSYELSEMTFHILYTEKNISSLLTTTFDYTSKMLEPKMFPYSVQYNVKPVAKIIGYNVYLEDSTKIGFTRFGFEDKKDLRMILVSNIKFEINKISWSCFGKITYNIIFIDFEIKYNGENFLETHHLIIDDYPIDFIHKNKTIQGTLSDAQSFKKFNSSTINNILFLIASTISLITVSLFILYRKSILFQGNENFKRIFLYKERK